MTVQDRAKNKSPQRHREHRALPLCPLCLCGEIAFRGNDGRSEREEDGAGGGVPYAVAGGVAEVEEERVGDDAGAGHRGDESGLAETEREASRESRTSSNCAATLTAIS